MELSGQRHALATIYPPGKGHVTHWIGGWVGLRASLDTEARQRFPNYRVRSPGALLVFWGALVVCISNIYFEGKVGTR
jgi:hypothetical protein